MARISASLNSQNPVPPHQGVARGIPSVPNRLLLRLVVAPQRQAPQLAKRILATPSLSPNLSVEAIIDLVITSMVYKFPNLTREQIMQVLELATEARQTRFYQDVLEEGKPVGLQKGRSEEGRSLMLCQLNRRVGTIAPELKTAQLEDLGEALLDFASVTDLEAWLDQHAHRSN